MNKKMRLQVTIEIGFFEMNVEQSPLIDVSDFNNIQEVFSGF